MWNIQRYEASHMYNLLPTLDYVTEKNMKFCTYVLCGKPKPTRELKGIKNLPHIAAS